jgi:hypothetical protein
LKKSLLVLFITSAVIIFPMSTLAAEPTPAGKISSLIGSVTIARQTHPGQSIKARVGLALSEGDTVKTDPQSRIEITFDGNYIIRCDEKTELIITLAKMAASKFRSPGGKLWLNVKHILEAEGITVESPTAVAAIRGTVFSVTGDSNFVRYAVYRGAIAVSPTDTSKIKRDTTLMVETGKELSLVKNFDKYWKEQQRSFEEYQRNQEMEYEKYRKAQQRGIDSMLNARNAYINNSKENKESLFKVLDGYRFQYNPIDTSKVSDWVEWNRERDKVVAW